MIKKNQVEKAMNDVSDEANSSSEFDWVFHKT